MYPQDTYLAARALDKLVGRLEEVAAIQNALFDFTHRYTINISAKGGIGKTRLLQHIMEKTEYDPDKFRVARNLIDLYHLNVISVEGLVHAIYENITREEDKGIFFTTYLERYATLQNIRTTTPSLRDRIITQRRAMLDAFIEDFNSLSAQKRIVLALDTAEKLFLQEDPIATELEIEPIQNDTITWLTESFLPYIKNDIKFIIEEATIKSNIHSYSFFPFSLWVSNSSTIESISCTRVCTTNIIR